MEVPEIKELDVLIKQHIGSNKTISSTKLTRLTAFGDNFGSEMIRVDLVLKCDSGKTENLSVVAKLVPISDFFKKIFNIQVTFKNEKAFYDTIVPTLQEFQRKHGIQQVIDYFPKFFGSRNNLRYDDGKVENEAVLILENLKEQGYENVNRFIGFDLTTAKLSLKHLAEFHGVSIALKHKEPETFNAKLKPYMACFCPENEMEDDETLLNVLLDVFKSSDVCQPYMPQIKKSILISHRSTRNTFKEPFATLTHRDLWCNNIMIKYNKGVPVSFKMVDFQTFTYESPATDILFLMYTTFQTEVLQNNTDELLKYYQEILDKTLKELDCDLTFTYQNLLDEINYSTILELGHIIFMTLMVVFGKKEGSPPEQGGAPDFTKLEFSKDGKKRIIWIVEEWIRRGWVNF